MICLFVEFGIPIRCIYIFCDEFRGYYRLNTYNRVLFRKVPLYYFMLKIFHSDYHADRHGTILRPIRGHR